MVGVGLFLAYISSSSTTLEGKIFSLGMGIFVILASIMMLRGVFQKRDECPICKDKYQYKRKKNAWRNQTINTWWWSNQRKTC